MRRVAGIVLGACALACAGTSAQQVALDAFLQSHAAARTSGVVCAAEIACDLPAAELRAQFTVDGGNRRGNATFLARLDLVADATVDDARVVARELFADLSLAKASIRVGRQITTWGVGDLLFINDTFPKNWTAFFTGQPTAYLKRGSDAFKVSVFPGPVNVELVAARFRPDTLPTRRRFVFVDPLPAGLPRRTSDPDGGLGDLELSARVSAYLDNWEVAGYLSHTHYHGPAWRVTGGEIRGDYPRLNTVGGSFTGPIGKGVINVEIGYYDSPRDRDGRDPAVDNSQIKGFIGYSRQLWQDATLGLQLYGEWMQNHAAYRDALAAGMPAKDRLRTVATLHWTQLFAHQTVTFNVFLFVGASENDQYLIPSLRYALTDSLWVEVGANLFGGARGGQFGALRNNDNVYATARYAF